MHCCNCKTLVMSGRTASNPLDVCGVMVATCIGNDMKINSTESTPSCCNSTLIEGEKPHASYRGCSYTKEELQRRRAQRAPKDSSGRMFSKFTSPEHTYASAMCQDTQHLQPKAPEANGQSVRHSVQKHLPQQEIQKTCLSTQAPGSSNNDMLQVATVVQQIMRAQ
jgi:hypothetical protein